VTPPLDRSQPTRSDVLLEALKKLHPRLIDLSLGRIERLLAKLGAPHLSLPPVIHIAGTNGKGSTSAFMRAMLEAAGYRVHTYTSPHLVRFHERIRLAREPGLSAPIEEAQLVEVLERVERLNNHDDITQFEITTAAALLAFRETPADAVILEVGLGGRLDATNVVPRPELSIITPVALDHADKLGGTIAKIAGEKAGILKPGVPAVISQQEPEAYAVIETRAEAVGAPLQVFGHDFDAYEQRGRLIVQTEHSVLDLPLPALAGRHQIINGGTAVQAAKSLRHLCVDEAAIERGLLEVNWPGRMQRLQRLGALAETVGPETEVWLDGGHNPAASQVLAATLSDLDEKSPKPVHLVVGLMGLKDPYGFLGNFRGLVNSVTTLPVPGALEPPFDPEDLAGIARDLGFAASPAASPTEALARLEAAHPGEKRVLICGSLYIAGDVLATLQ